MATIELQNICQHFGHNAKAHVEEVVNPFAMVARLVKNMQTEMTSNVPKGAFAIDNLNLTIPDGKTMVILGPSGCGKTTLLRIIAGLMRPESGNVLYDGVDVKDIPPGERQIGMVFQNYALYPHFTAKNNILSYFRFQKHTPELDLVAQEKYQKTSELLGVDIDYLLDKKPAHLSGGEKQRVAIGRCITREPKLFLLDEPFSNLDQPLREKYRLHLKKLLRHFHITTVYVTHDQQEAMILADLLAIMNIGRIEQVGTPEEIYAQPHSMFVAGFLNFDSETPAINFLDGAFIAQELNGMVIGVRSEDIEVCDQGQISETSLRARVIDVRHNPIKNVTILCVKAGNDEMYASLPFNTRITPRDELGIRFKAYHVFDKTTGLRIQSSSTR
ncbi:transporter [Candidatus Vecturithrix granuli]|uniref:Transporter n=1 Tax=Vecturithrix granuli TaxID=1499967 RepID=A0A081BTR4_VECG1|nr:transporter [Candidatus Vecturithrix granuli]